MDVTIIKIVLNTLDDIEVRGKQNLDAMLGCMNALESFVYEAESLQNKEAENKEVKNG